MIAVRQSAGLAVYSMWQGGPPDRIQVYFDVLGG